MTIAAELTIGLFAVVMLLWWKCTELKGLKRLFEVPWSGLDDGDASPIGAIESVVRAAAFTFVLLVALSVVAISAAGAWNVDILHWERKEDPAPKPCLANKSSCTLSLAPATIGMVTSEIRQELGASSRSLVDALNAQTSMQWAAMADGAAEIATLADRASTLSGDLKVITKQIEARGNLTDNALKEISQSIDRLADRATPSSTVHEECFTPEFRTDSDERLQRLYAASIAARQSRRIPDNTRFRVVSELTIYFSTRISELSAGAKTEVNRFLAETNVGNTALSIRGGADRQGNRKSNETLSRDRALNVAAYVVEAERYPPIVGLNWFGEDALPHPTDPGSSEPYNRTVHVKILQICQ